MTELITIVERLMLAPRCIDAAAIVVKGSGDVDEGFSAGVIVVLAIMFQYIAFAARTRRSDLGRR